MKNIVLTAALAAILAGCNMAPTYQQPAAPVAGAWPLGEAYKQERDPAAIPVSGELAWGDFITDDRLRRLIAFSLEHNRDLRVSILNIEQARAQYRITRADQLPQVNASLSQNASRVPRRLSSSGDATVSRQYSAGLGITAFELDFFGRVRNLSDAALERYLATEEARRAQQISLVAEVANAWLTLGADQELLELARDTLASQERSYTLSERRVEAGAAAGLDMYEARTAVEAARSDVALYTARVAADRNALDLLAGGAVEAALRPVGNAAPATLLAAVPDALPSSVLQLRPDVLSAEHELKAANADIGVARAAFFPNVSLTTSAGAASGELSSLFKAGTGTWSFVPQVNLPIFTAGANQANLALSRTSRDIALARYEKAIQSAFREVADALAQQGTLQERIAAQSALVHASERSYRIREARYQKGADTFLNALVSQRSLYAAQQGLINTRLEQAGNQIDLYKALGAGWR